MQEKYTLNQTESTVNNWIPWWHFNKKGTYAVGGKYNTLCNMIQFTGNYFWRGRKCLLWTLQSEDLTFDSTCLTRLAQTLIRSLTMFVFCLLWEACFLRSTLFTLYSRIQCIIRIGYSWHTLICELAVYADKYSYKLCTVAFIPQKKSASIYYLAWILSFPG